MSQISDDHTWCNKRFTYIKFNWIYLVQDYGIQDVLTQLGRVTHICISKQTIIGSDNGLSPGRRQAIIWTNAGILLIGTLGTNFSKILIKIRIFSFKKMGLKVLSAKWRPFVSASMCELIPWWSNNTLIMFTYGSGWRYHSLPLRQRIEIMPFLWYPVQTILLVFLMAQDLIPLTEGTRAQ